MAKTAKFVLDRLAGSGIDWGDLREGDPLDACPRRVRGSGEARTNARASARAQCG